MVFPSGMFIKAILRAALPEVQEGTTVVQMNSEAHKTCYRHQCIVTTKLVAKALNIPASKVEFSFQSRLGRDEWLKPYTAVRLAEWPKEGVKKLLILCPAFVSDCLENARRDGRRGTRRFFFMPVEKSLH